MSEEGETWKQLMIEASPSAMTPSDVAMLGPAPRDLTPTHEKFLKLAKPSWAPLWIIFAVFSIAGYAMMFAVVGFEARMLTSLWWPALMVGLAVWTGRNASRRRAALRRVLREGHLRFARLERCAQIAVGRGLGKRYRYHSIFDVDGRKVNSFGKAEEAFLEVVGKRLAPLLG